VGGGSNAEQTYSKAARYYDRLYAGKDYEGEVGRLIGLLNLPADGRRRTLLDVACGTGLHLRHLREHFDAEGLDICPELLKAAREKLPGIRLHLGDMTAFDLGRRFDVVTCLFSSIGYVRTLEGLEAAVRCMTAHLKPDGVMVIEPWFTPGQWRAGTVHGTYIDDPELKIARVSTSLVQGRLSLFDLHHLVGTPERTEHIVEHHEMGLFEVGEMTGAMERAGLAVRHDARGFDGRGLYIGRRNGQHASGTSAETGTPR
jgi:SAM-dependent methyltransferase